MKINNDGSCVLNVNETCALVSMVALLNSAGLAPPSWATNLYESTKGVDKDIAGVSGSPSNFSAE